MTYFGVHSGNNARMVTFDSNKRLRGLSVKSRILKTFAIVATLILVVASGCVSPQDGDGFIDESVDESEQAITQNPGLNGQVCDAIVATSGHHTPGETYLPATGFTPWIWGDRIDVPPDITYFTTYAGFFQRFPISKDPNLEEFLSCHNVFCEYIAKRQDHSGMLVSDGGGHFGFPERFTMLGNLAAIGSWEHPELIPAIYNYENPNAPEVPTSLKSDTELAQLAVQMVGNGTPIDAIVVSHPHIDHAGDTVLLEALFPQAQVVNTRWLRRIIERDNAHLAKSKRYNTTQCRFDHFWYDGKKYHLSVPVNTAHTDADSVMISPNGTMVVVDVFHAGRVTFVEGSVAKDALGLIQIGRYAQWAADEGLWTQASFGHFNIGYPRDVEMGSDYWSDLFDTWPKAMALHPPQTYLSPGATDLSGPFDQFFEDVANEMCHLMDGNKWAGIPFTEFCPHQAHLLLEQVFLRRYRTELFPFNPNDPFAQPTQQRLDEILAEVKVDFSPLAPGEGLEWSERCHGNGPLSPRGKVDLDTPWADSLLPAFWVQ